MDDDVAVETAAENVLAGIALGVRLGELRFEDLLNVEELSANIDVGHFRADRPASNETSLEEEMRIALHQHVILERAGLALVGVARDVTRFALLVDELPLQAGWKSGAAASTQAGRLHQLDDVVRLHAERLLQPVVSLVLEIEVERVAVRLANVFSEN